MGAYPGAEQPFLTRVVKGARGHPFSQGAQRTTEKIKNRKKNFAPKSSCGEHKLLLKHKGACFPQPFPHKKKMIVGCRDGRNGSDRSGPILMAMIIFLSAAVGALLARRMDAPDFPTISTPEFPTCEKGDAGEKGAKGDAGKCEYLSIPTRTHHAPNLAWLCPLCVCLPGKRCEAIHARATKLITNFHAACALCPADSATADSIIETTEAHIFFFDVGYPFRAIDTCGGKPVHSCVLCDNVTGIAPNCGVDNLGKMRDLHVTASRDMACRQNNNHAQCACIHAEELTPVSWSECAAIVDRNKNTYTEYRVNPDPQIEASKFVRYLGYTPSRSSGQFHANWFHDKCVKQTTQQCKFGRYSDGTYGESCVTLTNEACRPSRFLFPQTTTAETGLSLLMGTIGNISVADAISKFYSADKDAAGHVAIKAVCAARGAGTTCGGLTGLTSVGQTSLERAMLVPFGPITREGAWIDPVTLFSV